MKEENIGLTLKHYREVTVLKGAVVSETVSKFRYNDSIIRKGAEMCKDGIVKKI